MKRPSPSTKDTSYLVLYNWIRCRIKSGLIRSSVVKLHELLEEGYGQVLVQLQGLNPVDNEENKEQAIRLLELRHRLACLWCIYAHVIVELGQQARREQSDSSNAKHCEDISSGILLEDMVQHGTTILLAARECPLVGNHIYIVLALSRFMVTACVLQHQSSSPSDDTMSSDRLLSGVSRAITSGWDAMEACRGNRKERRQFQAQEDAPSSSISRVSNFRFRQRPSHKEPRISSRELHEEIESILELPSSLIDEEALGLESHTVMCDRNAIRALCTELNRFSRLKEKLETRQYVSLRRYSQAGNLLDYLPLFAAFDCPTDEPSTDSKWEWDTLEYAQRDPGQAGIVNWHWRGEN